MRYKNCSMCGHEYEPDEELLVPHLEAPDDEELSYCYDCAPRYAITDMVQRAIFQTMMEEEDDEEI